MQFHTFDPLQDLRWDDLVASHPRSTVFHQSGWLRALARTYGYRPVALTTTSSGTPLLNGVVFCEIESWITGKRLVSLPFSDHADPLLNDEVANAELQRWILSAIERKNYGYIELRPLSVEAGPDSLPAGVQWFWCHSLDLRPPLPELFKALHKDCFQRRIRHAEREHLEYERGSSDAMVRDFYDLLLATRKRHRILPQPRAWFRNLVSERSLKPEIRIVRKDGIPVAALFTLRHRTTVVYKYGGSDQRFHHLGGMPYLFWRLIEESKSEEADQIDLGRTETENRGLIDFKDRLGASRRRISYLRYPTGVRAAAIQSFGLGAMRWLSSSSPNSVLAGMGRLVYRHFG